MHIRFIVVVVFMAMIPANLYSRAQSIRIHGHAPEYSNYAIVFEHYQNFFNYEQQELFTIEVDDKGQFDFEYELDDIIYAFSDLGQFRGFIYLEPGHEYELKLPPFEPLSRTQELNPFFQPEQVLLGILNKDRNDLNSMIRDFDDAFDDQLNTNALKLVASRDRNLTREIIDTLDSKFPGGSTFFKRHKQFRYARLTMLTSRNPERDVIQEFFTGIPVQFSMPAYWEAFKDVFNGYGRKLLTREETGDSISFIKIKESIKKDTLFQRTDLSEALVLWSLYEAHHENIISPAKSPRLLDEVATIASTNQIRDAARVIHERINSIGEGTQAPPFSLKSFSGEQKSINDYGGKFIYLNFIHTDNYACRRDLKLLSRVRENFKRDLEIVTIVVNDDYEKAKQFLENTTGMDWDFLFFGRSANIIKNYNVKAVPLYYLINPEGKLVLSPAPAPHENFHDVFIDQYRKYQRQQQRKTPRKQRSIFGK